MPEIGRKYVSQVFAIGNRGMGDPLAQTDDGKIIVLSYNGRTPDVKEYVKFTVYRIEDSVGFGNILSTERDGSVADLVIYRDHILLNLAPSIWDLRDRLPAKGPDHMKRLSINFNVPTRDVRKKIKNLLPSYEIEPYGKWSYPDLSMWGLYFERCYEGKLRKMFKNLSRRPKG